MTPRPVPVDNSVEPPEMTVTTTSDDGTTVISGLTNPRSAEPNPVSKESSPARPVVPTELVVAKREVFSPEESHRAVHKVRLSALQHNYIMVESAASQQRCSIITVVKADGYGHGAIATALHLADRCGAEAFAVATLEEGIALRKAFRENPAGHWTAKLASQFKGQQNTLPMSTSTQVGDGVSVPWSSAAPTKATTSLASGATDARTIRPPQIRIIVLGSPVGYPRCFDDYYHHGIELMVSGPEVAASLMDWVADEKERKQTQVERAAMEAKEQALTHSRTMSYDMMAKDRTQKTISPNGRPISPKPAEAQRRPLPHPSSTLGNVQGQDLAREVRALLMSQQAAATEKQRQEESKRSSAAASEADSTESSVTSERTPTKQPVAPTPVSQVFQGIEAAAKSSRTRQMAVARANEVFHDDGETECESAPPPETKPIIVARMRLRWHALVDSGMGRLGFKTEPAKTNDASGRRETVDILKEMVEAEIHGNAPIEFYGMVTHMADASSTSDYTNAQIERFTSLLKRVRASGIAIPTVSTDNSAALMTESLTHFDAKTILSQPNADTRGFARIGGAIYGQRPAFQQLMAVSTLFVSVRHVAILKEGESVGYDRAYVSKYDVRIATLTIGFADGYPRELGNGTGKVAIRNTLFPVVGNVCMDMVMVELGPAGDMDGIGATVRVGDKAIMWGPDDDEDGEGLVPLKDLAATLKTTQSALTCGLNLGRVLRHYV